MYVGRLALVDEVFLRLVVLQREAVLLVDGLRALDVEVALQLAVVGGVAVGRREQRRELRAQQHRVHEARRVVDRPRREHDRRGQHRRAAATAAARATSDRASSTPSGTTSSGTSRINSERASAPSRARDADEHEAAPARLLPVPVREAAGWPRPRTSRASRPAAAVGRPEVRVQRRDAPRRRCRRRAPPTARPSSPINHTVPAPSRHDQSRCVSTLFIPSTDGIARKMM